MQASPAVFSSLALTKDPCSDYWRQWKHGGAQGRHTIFWATNVVEKAAMTRTLSKLEVPPIPAVTWGRLRGRYSRRS